MNHFLLYALFFFCVFVSEPSFASFCQDKNTPSEKSFIQDGISSINSQSVSLCDIHNAFNNNQLPRAYWLLYTRLQQNSESELIDLALTLASKEVDDGKLYSAEKIYKLVLAKYSGSAKILSSYAALSIYQQKYSEATKLINSAVDADPKDPLILNNAYLLAILNNDHNRAFSINKLQLDVESGHQQHILRRALLNLLYSDEDSESEWKTYVQGIKNENNRLYWKGFEEALRKSDSKELAHIASEWVDYKMPYESVMLLDYLNSIEPHHFNYYIKAKALERTNHLKLAYESASKSLQVLKSIEVNDHSLYGGILYETSRLAYAEHEYNKSLAMLDEYRDKSYKHEHIDYMYAVNLHALGRYDEARPYFATCSKQDLPSHMLDFCKKNLETVSRAVAPGKKDKIKKTSINVSSDRLSPSDYLKSSLSKTNVAWIGRVVDVDVNETPNQVHISWTAQYLSPEGTVEIFDGEDYEIKFNDNDEQLFQVNIYLNAKDSSTKEEIKTQFLNNEKYIIVEGEAFELRPYGKKVVAAVTMRHGIFTSRITEAKQ